MKEQIKQSIGVLVAVMIMLATQVSADPASELYTVWQHEPISITLPLNKSKTITFPNPVSVGVPPALQAALTINNQSGRVTFTAHNTFAENRIEVKDSTTGNVMILSLSVDESASTATVAILYHDPNNSEQAHNNGWLKTPSSLTGEMAYVTLTRFAEQQLYAPKRLIRNPDGIQLVTSYLTPEGGVKPDNIFHGLFYDHSTINIPWGSWRGGGYYVTAVLVRNTLSTSLTLMKNLPLLCGHDDGMFKAVTFFPSWSLTKAGSKNDTTVAFLVSTTPFNQAIKNCEGTQDE